jgi:heptosyltransferase-2
MCRAPTSDLLRQDPEIDELFAFSKTRCFGRRNQRKNIVGKLRKGKYDLGILLTHSFSSAWWFWQGKVTHRLGYHCNGRKLLLNPHVSFPQHVQDQHLVLTYKMLLQPLGIPISETSPRLYLTEKEVADASALLKQTGVPEGATIVGINPGATYGSAKCWPPEKFRKVSEQLLQDPDLFLLFFGDQATSSLVGKICQGLSPRVINFAGTTTLRQLASLISLCDVLLTNDSGPMHIADALGTPIVALFGSTSEVVTGPYRSSGAVIHKHVECSPCYQRTCPIDFRCMKRIEADEVYDAVQRVLGSKRSKLHITAL